MAIGKGTATEKVKIAMVARGSRHGRAEYVNHRRYFRVQRLPCILMQWWIQHILNLSKPKDLQSTKTKP